MMLVFCLWLLCLSGSSALEQDGEGHIVLQLGGFFPMEGGWPVGVYVQPMVELALKHVNENSTLLPNYKLSMTWNNTKCTAGDAITAANWQFSTIPELVGVIGEGCSVASEPIALLGGVYHMPQISYGSTSPVLSNEVLYPYFLRVCGSDVNQGLAWLAAAKHHKWQRVGTINSQESLHSMLTEKFLIGAQKEGISVIASESFPGSQNHDVSLLLANMAKKGVTIIFMACYSDDAARIFEEAKKIDVLSGPEVVFIGTDAWVIPSFWELSKGNALGSVGFSPAPGDSAFRKEIFDEYHALTGLDIEAAGLAYADAGYDAVLTFALGLHQILEVEEYPLTDIVSFRDHLYSYMLENTFFEGMTKGVTTFDSYGDKTTPYGMYNFQESGFVMTAEWDPLTDEWLEISDTIWPSNTTVVPPDRYPITFVYIGEGPRIAFIVIAALCAIVPVTFMIGLIVYWDHPIMVASTPAFMMCILFGTLMGISVVWVIAVIPNDVTCVLPNWLGHIAFWLVFSCLFVKTFRVWYIFREGDKLLTTIITNTQIFMMAAGIVLIVSIYLAIWTGLGRARPLAIPDVQFPEQYHIWICEYNNIWNIVIYAVEVLIL
eukprot:TRINITY_DN685_c0_g1_i2.p1 TRINITY_DN685_c0_g1~~TRINITY_DN685_c0_g1_i2.p1  ORF type:complete len:603 (-),score=62.94 TRINITY_DN685_c0_g1_i2:550-2358(-)